MRKRENTFKMPNGVICDPRLTLTARKVAAALYSHCNAFGYCHKSLRALAALSGVSVSTAQKAAKELSEAGWISVCRTYVWNEKLGRRVYGQKEYQLAPIPKRGWTSIPRSYIDRGAKLTASAFVIGLYLFVAGSKERRAYPSIAKIAQAVGVARSTVCRALHQIKQMGDFLVQLCRTVKKAFAANSYYLCTILNWNPVTERKAEISDLGIKQHTTYAQPEEIPEKRNPLCAFIVRLGKRLRKLFFRTGVVPNSANNS